MPFDLFGDWTSVAPHHIVAADVIGIRKKLLSWCMQYVVLLLSQFAVAGGRKLEHSTEFD